MISCVTGVLSLIDEEMRKMFFKDIPYDDILKITKPEINEIYNGKDNHNKTLAFMRQADENMIKCFLLGDGFVHLPFLFSINNRSHLALLRKAYS